MAASTREMTNLTGTVVDLTYGQMAIGALGLIALVGTISLSIRATNAAVEANTIARSNAITELRAYVSVKGLTTNPLLRKHDDEWVGWRVGLIWQNTGSTPAQNFVVWSQFKYFDGTAPDGFDYSIPPDEPFFPFSLGPTSETPSGGVNVGLDECRKAMNKEGVIYLRGEATYDDVFLGTDGRYCRFCFCLTPTPEAFVRGSSAQFHAHVIGDFNASN